MHKATTGWSVVGLGAVVATLGATLFKRSRLGSGIVGFGLAHMVLGAMDRLRPIVRN